MTVKEKIDQLRAELHQHNYNYYRLCGCCLLKNVSV